MKRLGLADERIFTVPNPFTKQKVFRRAVEWNATSHHARRQLHVLSNDLRGQYEN